MRNQPVAQPDMGIVSFAILLEGVRRRARTRVRNGEVTERVLATQAAVSQPYLHNVLKGVRQMTPKLADRLLKELDLTIEDLLAEAAHSPPRMGPEPEGVRPRQRRVTASR